METWTQFRTGASLDTRVRAQDKGITAFLSETRPAAMTVLLYRAIITM